MIGTTIGHYKIEEKLGEGGMGVVYKATDTKLNRTVALKFLPDRVSKDQAAKARFLQEAQAAAGLNHPNICTIHGVEEVDGSLFMVLELVEAGTLRESIPFPKIDVAIAVAIQVGEALQEAHSKGIVHRDIKADNIMLTSRGQAKVMDFGLAKLKGALKLTRTSSTVGTLAYMAPEQIQGGEVDSRSDIFSFGVLLFEMLTGKLPFRGEHEAAMVYSIVNEEPQDITALVPDLSPLVVNLIQRCLEKDPADRYQTMQDIVSELRRSQKKPSRVKRQSTTQQSVSGEPFSTRSSSLEQTSPLSGLSAKTLRIGVAVVAVLVVAAWMLFFSSPTDSGPTLSENRVVVAPFVNRTGDTSFDQLTHLIADELTQGLSQIDSIEVVPSSVVIKAVAALKKADEAATVIQEQDLGRSTSAGMVISGTIYQKGDQLQGQAQLVRTEDGRVIVALKPVLRSDPNALIKELKEKVLGAVAFKMSSFTGLTQVMNLPSFASFQSFRQGYEFFSRGQFAKAIPYFRASTVKDSTFIYSTILLAWSYANPGQLSVADSVARALNESRIATTPYERANVDQVLAILAGDYEAMARSTQRAYDLAPTYWGNAYNVGVSSLQMNQPTKAIEYLTRIHPDEVGDWESFLHALASAYHMVGNHQKEHEIAGEGTKRYPNDFMTLTNMIRAHVALGNLEDVESLMNEILSISASESFDRGLIFRHISAELRFHGHPEGSDKSLKKAFAWYGARTKQQMATLREGLATTYYMSGNWLKASPLFEQLSREIPGNMDYRGYLGLTAAHRGERESAMKISDWMAGLQRPYLRGSQTMWRARIAAVLGDKEKAIILLRDAFSQGQPYTTLWTHWDPDLALLNDYAPYQELMKPR